MKWTGKWRNEYGSILQIADDRDGTIKGTFRTALGDSGFAGTEVEISGLHRGPCVHFAFGRTGSAGDTIASFTGLMRDGKLKTMWHVVADRAVKPPQPGESPTLLELPWAHAVQTNSDTFERISD
jgi:hypothetical protein